MIRRSEEKTVAEKKMFDGAGEVLFNHILNGPEEMKQKGRVFAHVVLKPGCELGYHVHKGDGETYYILKGTAEYNDNGETKTLQAGDVAYCPNGSGHGIYNRTEENVEFIALILYED